MCYGCASVCVSSAFYLVCLFFSHLIYFIIDTIVLDSHLYCVCARMYLSEWGSGEDLGGVNGGETITEYFVWRQFIFSKRNMF